MLIVGGHKSEQTAMAPWLPGEPREKVDLKRSHSKGVCAMDWEIGIDIYTLLILCKNR